MLQTGDRVPDFTLPLATGEGRRPFRFRDALGRGDVLLVFYPIAFSGTCTEQVCDTRDALSFFADVDAQVFGFSTDAPHVNEAYVRHHALGFPVLSDPNRTILHTVWEGQSVGGVENAAKRGLMLVGPDGVVKWVWATDDADAWPGLEAVKAVLAREV